MSASIEEIRGSWSEEKKAFNRQFPWNYYVSRQLSFYVTWIFLRLSINANQATGISLVAGLMAAACFTSGNSSAFVAGALLFNLFLVLDGVDGNIARVSGSSSAAGKFYDIATGLVVETSFFFSIAVGLLRAPEALPDWMPAGGAATFAFATCTLLLLRKLLELRFALIFEATQGAGHLEPDDESRSHRASLARLVYLNLLRFNGVQLPWLLVATLTETLGWYVLFYFTLSSADFLRTIARCIAGVRRTDRAPR